jgi:hypothetical protein
MLNIPANADHKELGVQNHLSFGVRNVHDASAQLHSMGRKSAAMAMTAWMPTTQTGPALK